MSVEADALTPALAEPALAEPALAGEGSPENMPISAHGGRRVWPASREKDLLNMALTDFDYIATLGQTCAPTYQLQRAMGAFDVPLARFSGPFDWFSAELPQIVEVLQRQFEGYFMPAGLRGKELRNGYWRVVDGSGAVAWHQLEGNDGEVGPGPDAWFTFGIWLGQRIQRWNIAVRDPEARVLLIRNEGAFTPDQPADLLRLVELLRTQIAGRFTLVWARYNPCPAGFEDPNVRVFQMRRAWPDDVTRETIDWDRDYGAGVAWRGRDDDWGTLWSAL